tara:strand:- start:2062 stop:3006 length:945 start_codon:yes stop_codon:yes gene_type:complete
MGFLDNSGDIILDAVLTDNGRKLLSKGDGSFRITKFAVGDEEINYELYNINHASGSAYYDTNILATPILEAFTDNAASMKSKLVTFDNERLLYLPVLKLNTNHAISATHTTGVFLIAVDRETEGTDTGAVVDAVGIDVNGKAVDGILYGVSFNSDASVRIDQGIDSTEVNPQNFGLMQGLQDDVYIIQMDNRLGRITTSTGSRIGWNYVDDDDFAFYQVDASHGIIRNNTNTEKGGTETIAGPRGTILQFKIAASVDLNTGTYLFDKLGGTTTMTNRNNDSTQVVRYIDSMIRVTGMTSGYSIDVPVRYIKTVI